MNMKTWIAVVSLAFVAAAMGWYGALSYQGEGPSAGAPTGDGPCPGGAAAQYWKAPMNPSYVRDAPGKSPMGMDLVPVCPDGNEEPDARGIRVDSAVEQSMGVRTAKVERHDLTRAVRAVGRVAYDERLISHVHTKVQGWIEKLHVDYEGQAVKRGQPMLEIYSPELLATQEELLVASRYRETLEQSSFPDVREGGESLYAATRRRLELWDIPARDIDRLLETGEVRKRITLYAPSVGVVTHLMAREGMEVTANDNLYTIADLSRVWIYADVYEYEIPWVEVGQTASVELRHMPGTTFDAKVTYVYPFLDPKTRTVRVRLELDNPGMLLKPEMFANVVIDTETRAAVLAVPAESVIRSGRRTLTIVSLGDGRFEPREIELGIDSGEGWIEIRSGVREGELVVTSGQFLIDSESKLQEAVQKLLQRAEPEGDAGAMGPAMPGMNEAKPSATGAHEGPAMPGMNEAKPSAAGAHEGHVMPGMNEAPTTPTQMPMLHDGHDAAAHPKDEE